MNYFQAQNILDLRKAGADIPLDVHNKALELVGDIDIDIDYTVADAMCELLGVL